MSGVLRTLANAFRGIVQPQMLVLIIAPALVALVLWFTLAWIYWDDWSQWLAALISGSQLSHWLAERGLAGILHYSIVLLLWLLIAPMILITAVLIAALIEMPLIVRYVTLHDYPALEKRHGGTVLGSIANALFALVVFAVLWIVTLPLWITGVLAPVLPVVLTAYLNQRLFRYDALSEHASAEEYRTIVKTSRGRMYVLGVLLALLYWVPLVNFTVPILSGLAFTHFGLAELAQLRQMRGEGSKR